jgi:hypothetical protein
MKLTNKHIFILILIVGAILRFWDYTSISFTHDEFSAYFRTGFTDFGELVEKGLKQDTHPPGVQLFMNYWRLFFGDSPWIIKFPFTLMGLAAVYLIWKLGRLWYNETVALISTSFMASLQFTVMYSQLARPYISGLFLTLLMAWHWSKLVKKPEEGFWKNGILFVLAGALSAYNHHFSLLFAAIIGISGLFFIPKKIWWKYALLGFGIFALYIPNLGLFFTQLEMGGVGTWLGAPENDFLWMFIRYIFHFSWVLLGVAIALIIVGLLKKNKSFTWKKFTLFIAWFMIPFLIGFFYSRYKNPVIQYSVLLFSFPYLFFILFGHIKELKPKLNLLISVSIITLSTISLITNRQHYKILYKSPYRAIIKDQNQAAIENKSILRIIDTYPKMNHYYNEHLDVDTTYTWAQNFSSELEFKQYLTQNSRHYDQLFFGAYSKTNNFYIPIIKEYYPTLEHVTDYEGGSSYIFSKARVTEPRKKLLLEQHVAKALINGRSLWVNPEVFYTEYSSSYTIGLDSLELNQNDFIDISTKIKLPSVESEVLLVSDISKDGEVIHWSSTHVNRFETERQEWFLAHHTLPLSVLNLDLKGAVLKTYLYNKSESEVFYDSYTLEIRDGNPYLYGFYEEIFDEN